jgi:glycosyltransferase involved in cell wall biosynthesis
MVPAVSVVIATKNRAISLRRCLNALALVKTTIPWELVIVDNGSTDGTRRLLEDLTQSGIGTASAVKTVHEPIAGAGRAKNTGLKIAQGEFVSFIDDDCYVSSGYIDRIVALFDSPEIGYGGGKVVLHDPIADYPITIQLSDEMLTVPPKSYVETGLILGANMAFRRVVLDQIHGFDPNFGPGNKYVGDDPDIQARASFAGWHGKYDPSLVVEHHHGRDAAAAERLERVYHLSTGAYFAKFLLRRDTRHEFARHIYWRFRRKGTPLSMILLEMRGALGYLISRLAPSR